MIDDRDLLRHLEEGGDDVWARPQPPTLDLDAITRADRERQPDPAPAPRRWALRPFVAVGGALACVALGMVGGATVFGGAGDDRAPTVATSAPAATTPPAAGSALPARRRQVALNRFDDAAPRGAAAEASVFTATDGRTVDLRVKGLPVPRKGEFYELWVLGNDKKMISLGIIRVDASGSADVRMPLPVSLRRFPVFDISLEPGDGNPAHSGHSVLRSAAVTA